MSFYRIYRPQIIDEIDNIAVRESLLGLLTKPKKDLPHAFLFSGPRGGGKTTAARLIAKLFNCEKSAKTSGPCGSCEQCVSIAEGKNLDVLELDAASNRGIDEIRALRDGIALAPTLSEFKIYIIDEVHMLTTEAFNALLKTLEEPPKHAVFILATTDPQKVPVTIKSRCMQLTFTRATVQELMHALSRIVKKEKMHIDEKALELIARSVDGSFRDAVKLLEQSSFHKGNIDEQTIRAMLSLVENVDIAQFNDAFMARDAKKCLSLIQRVTDNGTDMKVFLLQILEHMHQLLLAKVKGESIESPWDKKDLERAIRTLSRAYSELKGTAIAQLPVELAVIEYCNSDLSSRPEPVPHPDAGSRDPVFEKKVDPRVAHPQRLGVSSGGQEPEDDKGTGSLTLEKLAEHWTDVIAELKPYNHSVAGVMRSTRPSAVKNGIVTIEAFYTFHKDKLSENKTRETIADVLKKLFGEKVKVEIVLGKK